MDCRLPGSPVHGIFQERILEWVAISFSRGFSQPRDQTWVSHIVGRNFTIWATRGGWRKRNKGEDKRGGWSQRKLCVNWFHFMFTTIHVNWAPGPECYYIHFLSSFTLSLCTFPSSAKLQHSIPQGSSQQLTFWSSQKRTPTDSHIYLPTCKHAHILSLLYWSYGRTTSVPI